MISFNVFIITQFLFQMPPGICLESHPIAPLPLLNSSHAPFSSPLRGGEKEGCFYISLSQSTCLLPSLSSVMTTLFPHANQYLNVSSLSFIYSFYLIQQSQPCHFHFLRLTDNLPPVCQKAQNKLYVSVHNYLSSY